MWTAEWEADKEEEEEEKKYPGWVSNIDRAQITTAECGYPFWGLFYFSSSWCSA